MRQRWRLRCSNAANYHRANDESVRQLARLAWLFAVMAMLAGCLPALVEPPRRATQTAMSIAAATSTPPPALLQAPSATPAISAPDESDSPLRAPVDSSPAITLWVGVNSTSHSKALEQMQVEFANLSGVQLEWLMMPPDLLPELVETAAISQTLPDLVLHPVEYSAGWLSQGILDGEAAGSVLDQLGRDTFESGALEMVSLDAAGETVAAIPSDGWQQLVIYRSDWFQDLGLSTPDSYEALFAAAEVISDPDNLVSGLVVPTDSTLASTQRVYEHLARANGCELVEASGQVTIVHPACLDALEFYRVLINEHSPIGFQTDISALNAYLAGRTGIIMTSPAVLPALADLDEEFKPICPECTTPDYLVKNSGILTILSGRSELARPANHASIMTLGITGVADQEYAIRFANYWFEDGYGLWLAADPVSARPIRLGRSEGSRDYLQLWRSLPMVANGPTLAEVYSESVVDVLSNDLSTGGRWALSQNQGAFATLLYGELLFSPLLQRMLSGYFTSSQTIIEMHDAVVARIPNYNFAVSAEGAASP